MTMPTDFVRAGLGLEYSLADLMLLGWRTFRRNFFSALTAIFKLAVAVVILAVALSVVSGALNSLVLFPIVVGMEQAGVRWLGVALFLLCSFVMLAAFLVGLMILYNGYLRAVVRSYEFGAMSWGELTCGWSPPWRRPLALFNLALAVPCAGIVGLWCLLRFPTALFPTPLGALDLSPLSPIIASVIFNCSAALANLLTLFIPLIIFAAPDKGLKAAVVEYCHILRNQPRRLVAVAVVPLAVALVLNLPDYVETLVNALSPAPADGSPFGVGGTVLAVVLWLVRILFAIYYSFVIGVCYRAAYGLPMTRQEASVGTYNTALRALAQLEQSPRKAASPPADPPRP